ncbi:hypothetical protein J2Z83_003134 [Virgibacillus natechei]|uniref:Uncharacterized protein n=1 Tax=Virgibacillus natechei TaxID=1216297 RepID=A0ABS4IJ61_9BACI|nr:hypothetical protein [Virgibacillus natechei]MBP1970997.1 hypothetical protein [Virgibacillus natechei]UZD12758.1 hypothetical protein OLD84_18005 [Virgibacillus natechei]
METRLDESLVVSGYQEFAEFILDDFNKHLLINTIENCIKGSEWPKSYFNLRDEFLPNIIGNDASSFFFWFALVGQKGQEHCPLVHLVLGQLTCPYVPQQEKC